MEGRKKENGKKAIEKRRREGDKEILEQDRKRRRDEDKEIEKEKWKG